MGIAKFLSNKQTQILCTSIACLSLISDNMQVSWSSPATPKLKKPDSPISNFNEETASWIERLYLIGSLIGLPITIILVDRLGRKPSIMIASSTNLLSWTLIAIATNKETLYVSRFLGGLSSAINFIAVSIYIAEIADKKVRGFLSSFNALCGVIGVIIMYSVAPFVSITSSAVVAASINAFQLVAFFFIPESPYLLIKKKKMVKCQKALTFLRNNNLKSVEDEFEEIKEAVQRQEKESHRVVDLFVDAGNRKATLIGCMLYVAEHFGCVTIILMNLQTILEDADGALQPEIVCILFAIVTLISCIIGMCVIDKIGRRVLLLSSIASTTFFLIIIATYFVLKDVNYYNLNNFNWIPIVCIICYGLSVKGGVEMVPVIVTAELFPTNVKAIGLTFADTVYVGCSLLVLYVYQILESKLGIYYPFYLYSIICATIGIGIYFFVPETNRKTLEEIQLELRGIKKRETRLLREI
nr:facilitated trehalose transporter Tret1-like isoform X1 [Onthophagus taurus]